MRSYRLRMVGGPYDGEESGIEPVYDAAPPEQIMWPRMATAFLPEPGAIIPNDDFKPLAQYRFLGSVPDKHGATVIALYAHVDPTYFGPPAFLVDAPLNPWQHKTLDVMAKQGAKIVAVMPPDTRKRAEGLGADEITTWRVYVLGDDLETTKNLSNRRVLSGLAAPGERDRYRVHLEEQALLELGLLTLREVFKR